MKRWVALAAWWPAACASFGGTAAPPADGGTSPAEAGASPTADATSDADATALLPIPGYDFNGGGGKTSIEDDVLIATIPASGPNGATTALREIKQDNAAAAKVDADFLIEDPGASYSTDGTDLALLSILYGDGNGDTAPQGIAMMAGGEPSVAAMYTTVHENITTQSLPYGEWFHIHLEVDLLGVGNDGFVRTQLGNGAVIEQANLLRTPTVAPPVTYFDFGVARYNTGKIEHSVTVHVKNVSVNPL